MEPLRKSDLDLLLEERNGPCISIYMPTHPSGSREDPIRLRNLLHRAERRLITNGFRYPGARDLTASLLRRLEEHAFWEAPGTGLAVFISPDLQKIHWLSAELDESLEVGQLFVVTPLIPLLHEESKFLILAISQKQVRLFEGMAGSIAEIPTPGLPRSIEEALRFHDRDEVLTYHTRPTSSGGWCAIFEGHGVGIDDAKDDLLLFFRQIDQALHPILANKRLPLFLASVDYLQPLYRLVNTYPHLARQGISGNPDRVLPAVLGERAWAMVEPVCKEKIDRAVQIFRQVAPVGKASADPGTVISAAYQGQLSCLFLAQGEHIWGSFEPTTQTVQIHDLPQMGDEDLSNFAAVHCLRHGHPVYVLPKDELPVAASVAGIYHLPFRKHSGRHR